MSVRLFDAVREEATAYDVAVNNGLKPNRVNQKRYGLIYDAKCIGNRRGFHNVCKAEFTPVAGKTPFD